MRRDQPGQQGGAAPGEGHAHSPGVLVIAPAKYQASPRGSVQETDHALVLDLETFGEVGDCRWSRKTTYEQHELILFGEIPAARARASEKWRNRRSA